MDTLRAALDALPMPEPFDYCYEWDGPYGTRKFSAAAHNGRRPDRSVQIHRDEAIRAAHRDGARLALERAVSLCEVTPPYPFRPSIEAAHAIRELLKELGND